MSISIITDFFKKHKYSYIIGIIFMFLNSYIQSLFPKLLGETIDVLKLKNIDLNLVKQNILYIMFVALGTFVCTFIWRNLVIGNARKLECYLREYLFNHFQKLSPEFYNSRKTGDLIAYAINDISAVRMTFGPATAMTINGITICIISIYSMSKVINWQLTLMSLIPIPFIVFLMVRIGMQVQNRFRKVQENFAKISDRVQENINGIRVIKAYVQEDDEVKNFEELNDNMMDSNIKLVQISALLSPIIEICFSISFVLNLIIGGNLVLKGSISLGNFIAFNGYLVMIMNPVISIGKVINNVQRGVASFKRLGEIFNVKPEITDGVKMLCTPIEGEIKIKDLSFSYKNSEKTCIDNINIDICKGHTLGIIGKTGSGKSTLVNLILKLYKVQNGKIYFDGNDINDYSLETLREALGYVPQDNFLFSASIKDNIKFFKDIYSNEDVENAAKESCVYETIENFPDGFDTVLGERGINISGGQKQRIAIARALIKNPAILILDDALSAVDSITEVNILNNLKRIRKNKTTIIISHRISAVENADNIIVFDDGKVNEKGTHKELLEKRGLYYDIYSEQYEEKQNNL